MVTYETAAMIETGKAMLAGKYEIEVVTNAMGQDTGRGVFVFDERGDVVEDLHVKDEDGPYVPVDFQTALAWCEAH